MKIIRNILWLAVAYFFLLVLKAVISRLAFSTAYFYVLMLGGLQLLLVLGAIIVPLCAWVARRWWRCRKPVLAGLLMFIVLMSGVEGLFACWLFHPTHIPVPLRDAYAYYYDYFQEDLIHFNHRTAVYDKELFYTLKHDTDFSFSNIEFDTKYHTNRLGLRDTDTALHGAQVICMGDSYTMGWGVEQQASFPSRLAAVSGYKVLNMGMASYGTAREVAALRRIDTAGLRWLIIQYCGNDLPENDSCIRNDYKVRVASSARYDALVHAERVSRTYFPGKYFSVIFPFFLKTELNKVHPFFTLPWERVSWGKDPGHQAVSFLDVLAHAPIDFGRVKVIVTIMDTYDNMKGEFLQDVKTRAMEPAYRERFKGGLYFMDLSGKLDRSDLYILDMHFRPSGHEKVANVLWDIMRPVISAEGSGQGISR